MSAADLGRQPITVVECDLRQVIGGAEQSITYRFSSADVIPPLGLDARPVITGISSLPTKLDIGESLGMRAAITIRCRDFLNDNDVAGGPAAPEATFFRLLKARVPYVANRAARIISGYLDRGSFTPERTLHYLLTKIDGPDRKGQVTLHCTDALVKADNRKAQAPNVGTGTLLTDLTAGDTTATISPAEAADDYHASGWLRFGDAKEICSFTRSGSTLTLTRGQRGTVAETHPAGDTIQEILIIEEATLAQVAQLLLIDYADLDPSLVDAAAWALEDDTWLATFRVSATIWDPTGVAKLLQELTQQFPFFIVYDARVPRLDFQAIKPGAFALAAKLGERSELLRDSIAITEDPEKRISQIWFYFGMKDPGEKDDDPRNYARLVPFIDRQAEIDHGEARLRKVYSRWLPADRSAVVLSIGKRMLSRLRDGRRTIGFDLDAKDGAIWVGDTVEITTRHLIDTNGNPLTTQAQIIEAAEAQPGTSNRYQAEDLRLNNRYCLYTDDAMPIYQQATISQRGRYGFYADDADRLDGGADPAYSYL
ncbi:MAG: hypothetical protein FKY71_09725 [Spiribacter salinus]|uniref:Uncharacterized protein n=1 Tax=Spiribacter salinus TaxID=1335746 RepID=A0A540VR51_9GAMM|nr:MAG: hypothetical protein FKY71_09725 [Spiribacter salinus]